MKSVNLQSEFCKKKKKKYNRQFSSEILTKQFKRKKCTHCVLWWQFMHTLPNNILNILHNVRVCFSSFKENGERRRRQRQRRRKKNSYYAYSLTHIIDKFNIHTNRICSIKLLNDVTLIQCQCKIV